MIEMRFRVSKEYLEDAYSLFRAGRTNSAVSRAYYASYQAMWAALGDPPTGSWKHLAIINHFVRGYWFEPDHDSCGAGLLEEMRLPLRRLYSYRIKSDYDAEKTEKSAVGLLLGTVSELIDIIEKKGG